MKTLKNILVPTNLSVNSLNVLQYALHQFNGYAFNITLLHVLPLPDAISDLLMMTRNADENEKIPADFDAAIKRLLNLFPLRIENISITHQYGLSSSILSQIMEEKEIDLIIYRKPSFHGNVNQPEEKIWRILDDSAYPVVYMPETMHTKISEKISFVLEEDLDSVNLLKEMLAHLQVKPQSEIKLVTAAKIDKAITVIAQFKNHIVKGKLFGRYKFSLHFLQEESYEESIIKFTQDYDVDMVFLLKRKTFLKRYCLNKHILHQTLAQSRVPLFTIA